MPNELSDCDFFLSLLDSNKKSSNSQILWTKFEQEIAMFYLKAQFLPIHTSMIIRNFKEETFHTAN